MERAEHNIIKKVYDDEEEEDEEEEEEDDETGLHSLHAGLSYLYLSLSHNTLDISLLRGGGRF